MKISGRMIFHRTFQAILIVGFLTFIISLRWEKVLTVLPKIGTAIFITIFLTVSSLIIGMIIAWPLALLRATRRPRWLAILADGFVAVFRGTPLLIQVYLVYFGLGGEEWMRDSFLWPLFREAYFCVMLCFSLNAAAYACEIFRGALVNGGKGEREAAMSLGLKPWQVNWLVWVPASWRRALPQYGNEMIFMMHGTAIAGLVTINDVFGTAKEINSKFYMTYEGMLTAAIIYVILTLGITQFSKWLERRVEVPSH